VAVLEDPLGNPRCVTARFRSWTSSTSLEPGETVTIDVTKPVESGDYAMLCPIPGHYQQGQLEEVEIQ
jgi:uncharacterized cupredoxin-like copper-binding protein